MHIWLTSYHTTCFPEPPSFQHPYLLSFWPGDWRQWPPVSQRPTPVCCGLHMCPHLHQASFPTPLQDQGKWTILWNASCNSPRSVYPPDLIVIPSVLSFIPVNTFRSPHSWTPTVDLRISWSFLHLITSLFQPPPKFRLSFPVFTLPYCQALNLLLHPILNRPAHKDSQRSWNWPLSEASVSFSVFPFLPSSVSDMTVHPLFPIGFSVTLLLPEFFSQFSDGSLATLLAGPFAIVPLPPPKVAPLPPWRSTFTVV